jgi:glycosyltransferase involved in cell wall biosynthesis
VEIIEIPWSEHSEVEIINTFDVGVMPLPNTEWARGKCAFKLVQYMACGVPVVASRVGANIELVTDQVGFLVGTDEEWIWAVRELRENLLKREQMARAARARVVNGYSLTNNLPILASIIKKITC